MTTVLVTGGTGLLGRQVLPELLAQGVTVRALARRPGPAAPNLTWIQGDVLEPLALHHALAGADTLLHLATQPLQASADLGLARALLRAFPASDVRHLIYMSICGLERMQGAPYYREKLEIEHRFEDSGVPVTLQRSTQFHEFIAQLLQRLTIGPVTAVPRGVTLQPVAAQAVARVLAGLALGEPAGRVPDLAGPDVLTMDHLARSWQDQQGRRGAVLPLPLPVPLFRAWQNRAAVASGAHERGPDWSSWLVGRAAEGAAPVPGLT